MKRIFLSGSLVLLLAIPLVALASSGTEDEVAQGKALWETVKSNQKSCSDLSAEDFENLGEYFMSKMMGDSHEAMNAMMEQMMGDDGEEAMHQVMGQRMSGCDESAAFPQAGRGFLPMMGIMGSGMMGGGWGGGFRGGNFGGQFPSGGMMGLGSGYSGGWLFMGFWWLLVLVALVLLGRWFFLRFAPKREETHITHADKLNPQAIAWSLTSVMGVLYILCTLLFVIAPFVALQLFSVMFHGIDITKIAATSLSFGVTVAGFLETVIASFLIGWFFAVIYNAFISKTR